MTIFIDKTHMGRRASGIERVTEALLSPEALLPLRVSSERASRGRLSILMKQAIAMPLKAVVTPGSVWLFPGFPPSPAFGFLSHRIVLYVHDVFVLTRPHELNAAARFWSAPNFARALKKTRYFLTNSATTKTELRPFVRGDAEILTFRPAVENVFDLSPDRRTKPLGDPLILGAIGTLEPRKNFLAAAKISQALQAKLGRPVELHIIGRDGWGGEWQRLAREPGVSLHGFLADDKARRTIQTFDALICTSYAEGLCLPLLEAQYAGLPVIAPDQPVFREVLDRSGLFIDPANTRAAADLLYAVFESRKSSSHESALATANIARWNTLAAQDREHAIAFLTRISAEVMAA